MFESILTQIRKAGPPRLTHQHFLQLPQKAPERDSQALLPFPSPRSHPSHRSPTSGSTRHSALVLRAGTALLREWALCPVLLTEATGTESSPPHAPPQLELRL